MGIQQPIVKEKKVYPNDPCPCGSGKKYKKCCGRKSKWRIFQLGKFFAAVLIEETKDSYMAYTKRKINPAYLDKTMSGAILKQMGKIKREEMINDRKIILKLVEIKVTVCFNGNILYKKQTVFLSPFFFAVQFSCISQDPVFYVVILLKSFYQRI